MVLELHIWGPAFGLPSIDAQCLATVAYLTQALPRGEWVLIASSDPSVCSDNELPALKNGSTWVSKYRNIVDYLRQYSAGQWDLDEDLDDQQRADCIAYSSFIESRGQPIVDLSLYVSSENYTNATRAAYTQILQWPNTWVIPPSIRAVARARSDHLGLSSLDVDSSAKEEESGEQIPQNAPKSLLLRQRDTVTSLLGKPAHRNQFKLEAVTDEFYEPLAALLSEDGKDKKHFFTGTLGPTSLDCLALGYLSLMLHPTLLHPWTATFLQDKYPELATYARDLMAKCYGHLPISLSTALTPSEQSNSTQQSYGTTTSNVSRNILPWQAPARPTFSSLTKPLIATLTSSIPVVSTLRTNQQLQKAATSNLSLHPEESAQLSAIAKARTRETYSQIAAVGSVLSLFAGYLLWEGIVEVPTSFFIWGLGWSNRTANSATNSSDNSSDSNGNWGEAGSLLGL